MAKVTIAQVHGYCLAGGTQLATICDITFVSEAGNQTTFVASASETRVGAYAIRRHIVESRQFQTCGGKSGR